MVIQQYGLVKVVNVGKTLRYQQVGNAVNANTINAMIVVKLNSPIKYVQMVIFLNGLVSGMKTIHAKFVKRRK
jgi:hypothetical protein